MIQFTHGKPIESVRHNLRHSSAHISITLPATFLIYFEVFGFGVRVGNVIARNDAFGRYWLFYASLTAPFYNVSIARHPQPSHGDVCGPDCEGHSNA